MVDIAGKRYGKLVALQDVGRASDRQALWKCRCDCGNFKTVKGRDLRCGDVKSCGCIHKNYGSRNSKTRLYRIWSAMKARCYNPKNKSYALYGGRGIKICAEWKSDFLAFKQWALSSGYASELSIDRIYSSGNYCPENCRWATATEQGNNTRRNHAVTWGGKTQNISQWERELGFKRGVLVSRICRGWSVEKAFSTPPYTAEDCGGAIKENRIDVFFADHQAAREFGVQTAYVYKEVSP